MQRLLIYWVFFVGHAVNEINKSGSKYLIHRLSDRDEIWHIDRLRRAVHNFHV